MFDDIFKHKLMQIMKKILFIFIVSSFLIQKKTWAQTNYLIRNVSVITMENDSVLRNMDVLISGGLIKQIGRNLQQDTLQTMQIDGANKYLIPGLADMHMHFWNDSIALRLYVANGVTTIRSMAGKPEYIKWQKEISKGKRLGPQLYCTGPLMNDVNFISSYMPLSPRFLFFGTNIILLSGLSYPLFRYLLRRGIKASPYRALIEIGLPVASIGASYLATWLFWKTPQIAAEGDVCLFAKNWEVRKAVREQVKIGYDAIKSYSSMTRSEFVTMMKEANKQKIAVVGHIPPTVKIDDVVKFKMTGLAHVEELRWNFYKGYDFSEKNIPYDKIDTSGLDNITRRLKDAGIFVTSSLIPCKQILERMQNDSLYFSKPETKYTYPKTLALAKKTKNFNGYNEKEYALLLNMFKSCLKNNVLIVLGTDASGTGADIHGFTVYDELKLMIENGLTPYEALSTATRNAAISVHDFDKWGTVSMGKRADLLLLDKNPLENINNTKSQMGLFLAGKWYDKKDLNQILQDVSDYKQKNDKVLLPFHHFRY
jgi:hypothetical protein